jgi:cytochrome P450
MSIPDLRARWTGGGAPDNPTLTRVTSFAAARRVLRTRTARQAGFTAERTREVSFIERLPVLFLEGEQHRDIRRSTARYFTPRHVARYDELMTQLAGSLVAGIDSRRDTRLADLTLVMAVRVAAQVLGLTDSRVPGLERRVERFSHAGDGAPRSSGSMSPLRQVRQRAVVGAFLALDVAPAVKARREHPRDDLISHLLAQQVSTTDILVEAITFATAGMITTREFISLAAWRMLLDEDLRHAYLTAPDEHRPGGRHGLPRTRRAGRGGRTHRGPGQPARDRHRGRQRRPCRVRGRRRPALSTPRSAERSFTPGPFVRRRASPLPR